VNPAFTLEATIEFCDLLNVPTPFRVPRRPNRPKKPEDLPDWFFTAFRSLWRSNKHQVGQLPRDVRIVNSTDDGAPYFVLQNQYRGLRKGEPSENEKRVIRGVETYALVNTNDVLAAQQATMGRLMIGRSTLAVARSYDFPDDSNPTTHAWINGKNVGAWNISIDMAIDALSTNFQQLRS
jgi:hypothetical protein